MQTISSKILINISCSTIFLIIIISFIGNTYEKEISYYFNNEKALPTYSILLFFFFLTLLATSLIALFIRHFPPYATKIIATQNPLLAKKIMIFLNPNVLEIILLVVISIIWVVNIYFAYELFISKTSF
jgi:hypothetical protein